MDKTDRTLDSSISFIAIYMAALQTGFFMEFQAISALTVTVYLVLALLVAAFVCFCIAMYHVIGIRTKAKPALIQALSWSGTGFMLFSTCGLVTELTLTTANNLPFSIAILAMFCFGLWMYHKSGSLKAGE